MTYMNKNILYIVASECKYANSQQGNFTGQSKNKQDLILLLWKKKLLYFSHFFSTTNDRSFKWLDGAASLFLSNGINMSYMIKNRFSRFTL